MRIVYILTTVAHHIFKQKKINLWQYFPSGTVLDSLESYQNICNKTHIRKVNFKAHQVYKEILEYCQNPQHGF
jgi:hypothetical protein